MTLSRRTGRLIIVALCVLIPSVLILSVCDKRESDQEKTRAQQQFEAQLQAEKAQRLQAEQAARAAETSRNSWITGLSAGACAICLVVLLLGIHIGSRAIHRYKKEHADG